MNRPRSAFADRNRRAGVERSGKAGVPPICLWVALAAFLLAASAGLSAAVECELSPDGSITTWLITPAFRLDPAGGFEADLLPDDRGERSGVRRSEDEGAVAWRGISTGSRFVDLTDRCLERGDSVFYAACELSAVEPGNYVLEAEYWGRLALWLDGQPLEAEPAADGDGPLTRLRTVVNLPDRRPRNLLVKLGSRDGNALFRIALLEDADARGRPARPAPVRARLRVQDERTAELVVGSLTSSSETGNVAQRRGRLVTRVAVPAGYPDVRGEVDIRAAMLDIDGEPVEEFEPVSARLAVLADDPAAFSWTVPDRAEQPHYTFEATVRFEGRVVGTLRRVFHVADELDNRMARLERYTDRMAERLGPRKYTEPDFALARLRHEKAVIYDGGDAWGWPRPAEAARELEGWGRALGRLERDLPRPVEQGFSEWAYLSKIDDSPQPYFMYVPRAHDGETPLPLIVFLHGYSPDLNKVNWEMMLPRELYDHCDEHGYYMAAPFARSNTDFQGVGEEDVLRVVEQVKDRFPIQADRVFLLGYSMGGMGAFTIGAHYPDRWAGIVSVAGRADYYLWHGLDRARMEPYKRLLIDQEFGAEMMGNFINLPVLLYHGERDSLIKTEQSRRFHRRLDALGGDSTLRLFPGADHWIMDRVLEDDGAMRWMNRQRLDRWPRRVDFKTYTIKYNTSYWVTILDIGRWGEPARVRAKLNEEGTELEVTTENVAALRLDLGEELVGAEPDLTLRLDGVEHRVAEPGPRTFDLDDRERVGELRKTPRLCGPAKQVFRRRFIQVFGIGEGGEENIDQNIERLRDEARAAAVEWYQFVQAVPLQRLDTRVTERDIQRANLVLHGTPGRNRVLARIADRLPIAVTDEGFTFRGETYDIKNHGLVMVYPNPLNPDRLVMVRAGLPYGGDLPRNHKYDLLPDFVIFKEGTDYDGTDRAVVAGFFDRDWQVDERLIWRRGDRAPDPRVRREPERLPPVPAP